MYNHNDYTYITDLECPYCENTRILRDNVRQETYCTHCGLILQDNNGCFMGGQTLIDIDSQSIH